MNNNTNICPYTENCGGCQLQGMPYQEQLNIKMNITEDVVGKYAPIAPIISMKDPTHYRNKSQTAYAMKQGTVINGKYRLYSHEITSVKACMLEDKETDVIFQTVNELMNILHIEPYDENLDVGIIRYVLVKKSFSTNQIMVVLVCGTSKFPHKKDFMKLLLTRHPNIQTVLLNINNQPTSRILGEKEELILYGNGYIEDVLCGMTFILTPKSFYHENSIQTEKLYDIAMKMAQLEETDIVLDAYCGTGTIGLVAAKQGIDHLIGIEINETEIMDAKLNATTNHIENAEFLCVDASEVCKKMAKAKEHIDVIFLEPPKRGTDERFLAATMKMSPRKIIYISCNVDTLDRDLRYINNSGSYKVRGIQPIDLFPYTEHIENIVLIEKK